MIHYITQLAQLFVLQSSPSMVSLAMSLLMAVWNSYPLLPFPELHLTWASLHFRISSWRWWTNWNEWTRLWNSISKSIATTSKTIGPKNPSIIWVCWQLYSECHYWHYTLFLPTRVIIQPHSHPKHDLHLHVPRVCKDFIRAQDFCTIGLSFWSCQRCIDSKYCQAQYYNLASIRNFQTNVPWPMF